MDRVQIRQYQKILPDPLPPPIKNTKPNIPSNANKTVGPTHFMIQSQINGKGNQSSSQALSIFYSPHRVHQSETPLHLTCYGHHNNHGQLSSRIGGFCKRVWHHSHHSHASVVVTFPGRHWSGFRWPQSHFQCKSVFVILVCNLIRMHDFRYGW